MIETEDLIKRIDRESENLGFNRGVTADERLYTVLRHCSTMLKTQATRVKKLEAEREDFFKTQGYLYIGKNGKAITARSLENRCEVLEAQVKAFREAATGLSLAIDVFWNDPTRPSIAHMRTQTVQGIEAAQSALMAVLQMTEQWE